MMTTRNPYTPMLLTYNPARFYGRENEVTSILQVITAPEPNGHAIYGIRTIGKTTLLKYLRDSHGALAHYSEFMHTAYRPGGGGRLLFVYLNFHNFRSGHNLFYLMLEQLREDLEEDALAVHIPDVDEDASKQAVVNTLREVVQTLAEHRVRVVFLLDDFDTPLHHIETQDDMLLRSLNDDAALIIATEDPISELRPDIGDTSPLLGILRPEAIGLMIDRAARQLISEPAEGVEFSTEEENFLMSIAGRQPFLLIAACELYYDMRNEYPDIAGMHHDINFQRQFMYRLRGLPHVEKVLNLTWNRLEEEERLTLHDIARASSNVMNVHARRLENMALVYWDVKQGFYRVFGALFSDYANRIYTPEFEQTPGANQLVDSLSPVDRALLQYFLHHPNQVCTFEELLASLWDDPEATKKRALEASVHRLRRHLGDGEQIKNVRGRGYKFVTKVKA
jgi:hypothetical protein